MPLIYKLYDELDCYVGSTTLTLKERLSRHISSRECKSVIILDRKKFTMELIEEVETKDRFKREQYWIDSLSTLSQRVCYFESEKAKVKYKEEWRKQYYETNLESITEKIKVYRENNKDKIKEQKGANFNCECGGKYTNTHKARHLKTKKHLEYIDEERQKSNQS